VDYIKNRTIVKTDVHLRISKRVEAFPAFVNGFFQYGIRFLPFLCVFAQKESVRRIYLLLLGFTTLDFSEGYTFRKISLLAKMSNITNTYNYYVHENYSINPIAPAQFSATVSYKF